jgi:hypothetical protein
VVALDRVNLGCPVEDAGELIAADRTGWPRTAGRGAWTARRTLAEPVRGPIQHSPGADAPSPSFGFARALDARPGLA